MVYNLHTIHPAGGYRIYETIYLDADGFVLEGIPFHTGHKIAHALRGSSSLAVVSITLGEDISRLIEQYNKEFDFITAYWLDKLSNWALEQLMRPVKSMSGVVGIGDQVIYKESGCGDCRLPNCDRTIGLKRLHDWAATTARLGFNDRTIQLQRALQFLSVFTGGIAGYLLELFFSRYVFYSICKVHLDSYRHYTQCLPGRYCSGSSC